MILPGRRELGRYEQVAAVLARNGIGLGADRSGLARLNPFRLGAPDSRPTTPQRLRLALEELGVTFIKLGQVLSTREDVVPPEYARELARLQDGVPPAEPGAIRERIEAEFGLPVEALFADFEDEPLASASIGQVHAARLPDGRAVVVKVQKPGVEEQVETDLRVMRRLAEQLEQRSDAARRYRALAMVEELRWILRAELDYLREGRNAERFAAQFAEDPFVRAPRIYWDRTTRRVLTMERVEGIRIGDLEALEAAGVDRRALARRFARMLLASVLLHGFFHGDPHPGNYLVGPDGSITAVDFGMTGHVTDEMRAQLVTLLLGVVKSDVHGVAESLAELGIHPAPDQRSGFRRDVAHLLDAYYGLELADLEVARLLGDFAAVARAHAIAFPPELALLTKVAATGETVTRQLDPTFNPAEEAEEFAREALVERYSPRAVAERITDTASEAVTLVTELPGQLRRVMRQVEQGDFEVRLRRDEIEMALDGISSIVNRLGAAIIGAAIAIAVALVLQIYRPPGWQIFAAVTLFGGPVVVTLLWVWAALSTRRRG